MLQRSLGALAFNARSQTLSPLADLLWSCSSPEKGNATWQPLPHYNIQQHSLGLKISNFSIVYALLMVLIVTLLSLATGWMRLYTLEKINMSYWQNVDVVGYGPESASGWWVFFSCTKFSSKLNLSLKLSLPPCPSQAPLNMCNCPAYEVEPDGKATKT